MNHNEQKFSLEREFSEEELTPNRGLKLKNKPSQKINEAKARFDTAVSEAQKKHEDNMQEALRFGQQYMGLLADKTLTENKGPIQRSLEKEIINQLQEYSTIINNDEDERLKCMGSASLFAMILPAIFKLRDRINDLEYQNQGLSKKIEDQAVEIKRLSNLTSVE